MTPVALVFNMPTEYDENFFSEIKKRLVNALETATELVFASAVENCPVDRGDLRAAIRFHVDKEELIGEVGLPQGSELEHQAFFNEYGTGQRGLESFISFRGELAPEFTIPIVPINKKAMAFVKSGQRPITKAEWQQARKEGRAVIFRSSKGMPSRPFIRPAVYDNEDKIAKVFKNALMRLGL